MPELNYIGDLYGKRGANIADELLLIELERLRQMLCIASKDVANLTGCKPEDYQHDLSTRDYFEEVEMFEKEAEENSFRYTLDKPWVCEVERKQIMTHFGKGYLAGAEPRERRIAELEKENTELKEQLGNKQMQSRKETSDFVWKLKTANEQKTEQLTKAKELLKKWVQANICDSVVLYSETEQFLNSEVEK